MVYNYILIKVVPHGICAHWRWGRSSRSSTSHTIALQKLPVRSKYHQFVTAAHYSGFLPCISVWNSKSSALVLDEAIEAYAPLRRKAWEKGFRIRYLYEILLLDGMLSIRNALPFPEHETILLHAPSHGSRIEVGDIDELPSLDEILLHISHETFDCALCERMCDTA